VISVLSPAFIGETGGRIVEEILDLKATRNAIILAHHYQDSEIQDLADSIGDSLELSRRAQRFTGDVIAFCGVKFMAETAKVLSPHRAVVVPDLNAGCSLVDACRADDVRAFRARHPEYAVVSYINTSVEVKAESDILCTSRNAVKIVNSIPAEKPILFLPDVNLGNYVRRQTGRLVKAKSEFPAALVAAHPECTPDVLALADFVGSTSAIVDWCVDAPSDEIIVMTESGVAHSLRKAAPEKTFYFVPNENCNCSECPHMRLNTLEKLRDCLQNLTPRIEIPADILRRAALPIERMLSVK
jgi:quinolinate synthase